MRQRTPGMAFIFITLLIDVLGFGLIIPVLPSLVASLSHGGPTGGAHVLGLLLSCYGLMQFLFSPILGSLSDRYGRRPVILLSLFFTGIDYILMARAPVSPGCSSAGRLRALRGRVLRRQARISPTSARPKKMGAKLRHDWGRVRRGVHPGTCRRRVVW